MFQKYKRKNKKKCGCVEGTSGDSVDIRGPVLQQLPQDKSQRIRDRKKVNQQYKWAYRGLQTSSIEVVARDDDVELQSRQNQEGACASTLKSYFHQVDKTELVEESPDGIGAQRKRHTVAMSGAQEFDQGDLEVEPLENSHKPGYNNQGTPSAGLPKTRQRSRSCLQKFSRPSGQIVYTPMSLETPKSAAGKSKDFALKKQCGITPRALDERFANTPESCDMTKRQSKPSYDVQLQQKQNKQNTSVVNQLQQNTSDVIVLGSPTESNEKQPSPSVDIENQSKKMGHSGLVTPQHDENINRQLFSEADKGSKVSKDTFPQQIQHKIKQSENGQVAPGVSTLNHLPIQIGALTTPTTIDYNQSLKQEKSSTIKSLIQEDHCELMEDVEDGDTFSQGSCTSVQTMTPQSIIVAQSRLDQQQQPNQQISVGPSDNSNQNTQAISPQLLELATQQDVCQSPYTPAAKPIRTRNAPPTCSRTTQKRTNVQSNKQLQLIDSQRKQPSRNDCVQNNWQQVEITDGPSCCSGVQSLYDSTAQLNQSQSLAVSEHGGGAELDLAGSRQMHNTQKRSVHAPQADADDLINKNSTQIRGQQQTDSKPMVDNSMDCKKGQAQGTPSTAQPVAPITAYIASGQVSDDINVETQENSMQQQQEESKDLFEFPTLASYGLPVIEPATATCSFDSKKQAGDGQQHKAQSKLCELQSRLQAQLPITPRSITMVEDGQDQGQTNKRQLQQQQIEQTIDRQLPHLSPQQKAQLAMLTEEHQYRQTTDSGNFLDSLFKAASQLPPTCTYESPQQEIQSQHQQQPNSQAEAEPTSNTNAENNDEAERIARVQRLATACGQRISDLHQLPTMQQLLETFFKDESVCKLGEGSFGEAYQVGTYVVKVVPLEGQCKYNGERQKLAHELLGEVLISRSVSHFNRLEPDPQVQSPPHGPIATPPPYNPLNALTPPSKMSIQEDYENITDNQRNVNAGIEFATPESLGVGKSMARVVSNSTEGFIRTYCVNLCRAPYADVLQQEWERWHDDMKSENDNPKKFGNEQLYMVLLIENGGKDIDCMKVTDFRQWRSFMGQLCASLAVAEQLAHFEHRDLHFGNVLIKETEKPVIHSMLSGKTLLIPTFGHQVKIIDFTLSRLHIHDGGTYFCDLDQDPALFKGKQGDIQADTYRSMQTETDGKWRRHFPRTNCLWMAYLARGVSNNHQRDLTPHQHRQLNQLAERFEQYSDCSEALHDPFFKKIVKFPKTCA